MTKTTKTPRDIYNERADEAESARSEARDAAASIARTWSLTGLSDPAYIANVIEAELERFEQDAGAPLIQRPWTGGDPTVADLLRYTSLDFPHWPRGRHWSVRASEATKKGIRSAAIRIQGSYPLVDPNNPHSSVETTVVELTMLIVDSFIAARFAEPDPIAQTPIPEDLDVVNSHRRQLGMKPLDLADGWTTKEIADMAEKIRTTGRMANPVSIKRKLMR
jgi:hypothetical protein